MKSSALVVLSGGQDSTTCLLWAKREYDIVHTVSFDYGQKHSIELSSAAVVSLMVGADSHRRLNVSGLLRGRSPLVNPRTELETYTDFDSMDKTIGDRVELTFVPLRNPLFLLVAANLALSLDCYNVVTGVCAMDNANYPDCSQMFVNVMTRMMREALGMYRIAYDGPQLNLVTPLIDMSKAETVALAASFPDGMATMAYTHTCYAGKVPPCGVCHACTLRAEGFKLAGVPDPLIERVGSAT